MIDATAQTLAQWIARGRSGVLSVVIPAHNEEGNLKAMIPPLIEALTTERIEHEILVVNDNSTDGTESELIELERRFSSLRHVNNPPPNGFGLAVRCGLVNFTGEAVAIVMADGSELPTDVVACWRKLNEGYDCVFGSRFIRGGRVVDYPLHKLIINRIANTVVRILFRHGFNDTTNAFKVFRREVIAGIHPILSYHFNITVELPLKALIRGYSFAVVPISWFNRKSGASKLKIREMGSRYFFIVLYCFLEKILSRGDYRRTHPSPSAAATTMGTEK